MSSGRVWEDGAEVLCRVGILVLRVPASRAVRVVHLQYAAESLTNSNQQSSVLIPI